MGKGSKGKKKAAVGPKKIGDLEWKKADETPDLADLGGPSGESSYGIQVIDGSSFMKFVSGYTKPKPLTKFEPDKKGEDFAGFEEDEDDGESIPKKRPAPVASSEDEPPHKKQKTAAKAKSNPGKNRREIKAAEAREKKFAKFEDDFDHGFNEAPDSDLEYDFTESSNKARPSLDEDPDDDYKKFLSKVGLLAKKAPAKVPAKAPVKKPSAAPVVAPKPEVKKPELKEKEKEKVVTKKPAKALPVAEEKVEEFDSDAEFDYENSESEDEDIEVDNDYSDESEDDGEEGSDESESEDAGVEAEDDEEDDEEEDEEEDEEVQVQVQKVQDQVELHQSSARKKRGNFEDVQVSEETLEKGKAWTNLFSDLDHRIIKALVEDCHFLDPTIIQSRTIPSALVLRKDLLVASPTGSGKTLAFGIPILQLILNDMANDRSSGFVQKGPYCLILSPTRELALQITSHFLAASRHLPIQVVPVVGGISTQKQDRLLSYNPQIVVGTPGRLWDLINMKTHCLAFVQQIRYLVIDEADRMIETGHFREVTNIFGVLPKWTAKSKGVEETPVSEFKNADLWNTPDSLLKCPTKRQTIVCSATLSSSQSLMMMSKRKQQKTNKPPVNGDDSLDMLLEKIDFQRDRDIIDLTNSQVTASALKEAKLFCLKEEKDCYLYYFLAQYVGKTIIFVNSIHCLKRLRSILTILKVPLRALHAQMQQRQRLKNLEKFYQEENSVLLASDVAARGLDIPFVDYVIHYQVPRNPDIYVHRSGRTARAQSDGMTLLLVSPEDRRPFQKILSSLNKGFDDIRDFPIDMSIMINIRKRVSTACDLDKLLHSQKDKSSTDWYKKAAEECDLDLDEDMIPIKDDEQVSANIRKEKLIARTRERLDSLLQERMLPRGISRKVITQDVIKAFSTEKKDAKALVKKRK